MSGSVSFISDSPPRVIDSPLPPGVRDVETLRITRSKCHLDLENGDHLVYRSTLVEDLPVEEGVQIFLDVEKVEAFFGRYVLTVDDGFRILLRTNTTLDAIAIPDGVQVVQNE